MGAQGVTLSLALLFLVALGGAVDNSGVNDLEVKIRAQRAHIDRLQAKAALLAAPKRQVLLGSRKDAESATAGRIVPELRPTSDKTFFGRRGDYPTDVRPAVLHHFQYPFPIVQDSNTYDTDYVKDENNDKGDWDAQLSYDKLRTKLTYAKEQLAYLKKNQGTDHKHEEADLAKKEAEEAANAADAEKKNVEEKQKADEDAATKADAATAEVEKKEEEVTVEVKDLDDCKAQLAEAKTELGKLMEEKAAREAEEAAKHAKTKEAEVKAAEAETEEKKQEAALKEEDKEEEEAEMSYAEAKKEYEKAEKEIDGAEKELRRFRGEEIDKQVAKRSMADGSSRPCPKGCKSSSWLGGRGAGAGIAPGAPVLALLLAAGLWRAA